MSTDEVSKIVGNGFTWTPNAQPINALSTIDKPIVIMITEMMGSPIIGRSTTTCSSTPKMNMTANVIGKPTQNGKPNLTIVAQQIQAPTNRNWPWAKFTIWVDL